MEWWLGKSLYTPLEILFQLLEPLFFLRRRQLSYRQTLWNQLGRPSLMSRSPAQRSWKSTLIAAPAQQFSWIQSNFRIFNSFVSGLTISRVLPSLLFSRGCCRTCQASRQVSQETQLLKSEYILDFKLIQTFFLVRLWNACSIELTNLKPMKLSVTATQLNSSFEQS